MEEDKQETKPPIFNGKYVSKFLRNYESYIEDLVLLRMLGKEVDEKVLEKQKVMLLKNRVTDVAFRNEVISNAHYKSYDWDKLKEWMLTRWESQDSTVTESDLRELVNNGHSVEDFVSRFTMMVTEIHEIDMPQGRVLTDLFTRGIGKEYTLAILTEMKARDAKTDGTTEKYLNKGYPVSWVKCKEILDSLGVYHNQLLPVLKEGTTATVDRNDKGVENLIKQMEQLNIKLAKLESNRGNTSDKKKLCLFCDLPDCLGAVKKKDCPSLKPYLEKGLVTFTEKGHFADKNGKMFQLKIRQGGVKSEVDKNLIANHHIEYYGEVPVIPSNHGILAREINAEPETLKTLLDRVAENGLEDVASELWKSFNAAKRPRVWEDEYGEGKPMETEQKPMKEKSKVVKEREEDASKIADLILNTDVTLPLKRILSVAPSVKSKLTSEVRKKQSVNVNAVAGDTLWDIVEDKQNQVEAPEDPVSTSTTARMPVSVNGKKVMAHFDGGSEINVMTTAVAKRLDLPVTSKDTFMGMIGAGGQRSRFVGEVEIKIVFGTIETPVKVFVLDSDYVSYDLLLGKPYGRSVGMVESTNHDGSTDLIAVSTDGKNRVHYKHDPVSQHNSHFVSVGLVGAYCSVNLDQLDQLMKKCFDHQSLKTKYKPVGQKKKPVAIPLVDGSIPYSWDNDSKKLETNVSSFVLDVNDRAALTPRDRVTPFRMGKMVIGRDGNLSPEERELLENVIIANEKAFSFELDDIGTIRDEVVPPYLIRTIDHQPVHQKPYPLPRSMTGEVHKLLPNQLEIGLLELSHGPYAINWFCARKANGGLRLIHDMQKVNEVTIRDACIPPDVEEIVERASGNPLMSVLDVHSGYEQRNLDPVCRDLTAIITSLGLVRKTRSPQGGTNSVGDFQRTMVKIFQAPITKDCLSVYVDDVAIFPDRNPVGDLNGIRKEVISMAINLDLSLKAAISSGLTFTSEFLKQL